MEHRICTFSPHGNGMTLKWILQILILNVSYNSLVVLAAGLLAAGVWVSEKKWGKKYAKKHSV